jgi:anti-sigma regulatory factor (Ser/Thr protein kinase)
MAAEAQGESVARITLAAESAYVGAALALLREAGTKLGLAAADVDSLARAVGEVALNVIAHAFEPGQRATFDIVLMRRPGQIAVAIEDQGLPFDYTDLQAESRSSLAAPALAGSLDAVHFTNLGPRGNRVELVKRLAFAHIETRLGSADERGTAVPVVAPDVPISLRLMTADDAVGIARCTYRCYGYSIPDEFLYYPDHLCEMLQGGLLEVCVAVTEDDEIVGVLTVELDHPRAVVGNLGEAMVDPRFRGHRLFERMIALVRQRAAEKEMLGLYGEAVTVHPFSQKGNIALGATETGVQLGDEAPVTMKQIDAGAPRKRTATILYYFKTSDGPARAVHAPPHHRMMIERIYRHGGFPRTFEPVPALPPERRATSQVKVELYPEWSEAAIRVAACGSDLPELVRFRLRELCLRRVAWIGLDLPLSDAAVPSLCAALEALGFFFAGVVPELADGDVLRLQYLNEVDVEVASAQIASDFGRELFGYVVKAMPH